MVYWSLILKASTVSAQNYRVVLQLEAMFDVSRGVIPSSGRMGCHSEFARYLKSTGLPILHSIPPPPLCVPTRREYYGGRDVATSNSHAAKSLSHTLNGFWHHRERGGGGNLATGHEGDPLPVGVVMHRHPGTLLCLCPIPNLHVIEPGQVGLISWCPLKLVGKI